MQITGIMTWAIALFLVGGIPLIRKGIQILLPKIKLRMSNKEDSPIPFGYKMMWIAVKTDQKEKVGALLGLKNLRPSNWKNGMDGAYGKSIFITPLLHGWTLAVGMNLPTGGGDSRESIQKLKALLKKLSAEFGEAQFFCTHRIVEYHCWIKAKNGKVERAYAYLGESAENIVIEGNPTAIEANLNLINTFSPEARKDEYFEREDILYPDEDLVMTIAEDWSVNPTTIENDKDIKGMGLIG